MITQKSKSETQTKNKGSSLRLQNTQLLGHSHHCTVPFAVLPPFLGAQREEAKEAGTVTETITSPPGRRTGPDESPLNAEGPPATSQRKGPGAPSDRVSQREKGLGASSERGKTTQPEMSLPLGGESLLT